MGTGNDRQFQRFCAEIGRPDLPEDARFRANKDRVIHRDELSTEIKATLARVDGEALAEKLLAQGVPCGPVRDLPDTLSQPHTLHREMVISRDGNKGTGTPIKFSRTPGGLRRLPPSLGEASREVLSSAGYSSEEIEHLVETGVVPLRAKAAE